MYHMYAVRFMLDKLRKSNASVSLRGLIGIALEHVALQIIPHTGESTDNKQANI